MDKKRYSIADFSMIKPVECPCGISRRAFLQESMGKVSYHIVEIHKTARKHYHKNHQEIYYILDGTGYLEADEEKIPVQPGSTVLIREFCRHRAVGNLRIINVSIPAFDPEDEWLE